MPQWPRTECNRFPLNVKEWRTLGWISWSGLAGMTKFFRPQILQEWPRMCYHKFLKTFLFHVKRPFISHLFQCFLTHLTSSDALLTHLWFLLPAPAQLNGKDGRRVLGCNAWGGDFEVLTASQILLFSVFLTLCQSFYHSSKLLTNLLALCTFSLVLLWLSMPIAGLIIILISSLFLNGSLLSIREPTALLPSR